MKAGKMGETIMWILTGLAVLVVIIGFLQRPDRVPIYAKMVKQNLQFQGIEAALELFNNAFDYYPPSGAADSNGVAYCGAMKLCEALMGRDLFGFHSNSIFRADGRDAEGRDLYDPRDLSARKWPYLPAESAEAVEIEEIWTGTGGTGPFLPTSRVLCDVYTRRLGSGKKVGMPVLYYKADTSKTAHDVENPDNPENIYNYEDNHALLGLGVPGQPDKKHPLFVDPKIFYEMTRDTKVKTKAAPCNADSFILISAGLDGLYGTKDDVVNFGQ